MAMTTPAADSSENQNNNSPRNPDMTQNEEPPHQPPPPSQQLDETPASPKTLNPEISTPQDQVEEDQSRDDDVEMLSPVSQPISERHVSSAFGVTYTRRGASRKQQKKRAAMEKKWMKKLELLEQTLKIIPFSPVKKTLDLYRHESLLKGIGLWDFVHLELDTNIREDLIAQLIATYSPASRCSYVKGVKIGVNRADLARALNLPSKKDKVNVNVNVSDWSAETKELEESIGFVLEIVANWMLLHDDMWILPDDVMKTLKLIQEGSFEKVDWCTLIWFMMEKELLADPVLGNCYYASYMQCLIKGQKNELLLREEVKEEVEEDGYGDVKMCDGFDDVKGSVLEEQKIELSLGHDNVVDLKANVENNLNENVETEEKEFVGEGDVIGAEGNKNEQLLFLDEKQMGCEGEKVEEEEEEEENGQWFSDDKDNVGQNEHLLRRCTVDGVKGMVCEDEEKKGMDCEEEENKQEVGEGEKDDGEQEEEEEQQQEEGGFSPSMRDETLEMVTSANLIQGMEAVQVQTFRSEVHLCDDDLQGEFLSSRDGTNTIPGGSPSHFGNGNKRVSDDDNELSYHSLNGGNKRLRSEGLWDNKSSSEFYVYMEQMQHLMAKVRMHYEAKEQSCEESNVNQQFFINEVQRRDSLIEHLQKAKYEVEQKRHEEVYRLERELFLMGNILEGYRKALKDTRKEFAEYRARCTQPDEPLYKDVPCGEGLVLSVTELEKQCLKQEEEERMNRLLIEKKLKDFEGGWIVKFEEHKDRVQLICDRLLDFENEVKPLKELLAKRKVSETSECVQNELSGR